MTYYNAHSSLVLTVVQHVSTDRLQRAVTALADSSLTMTLTRQTETEIRVLVKNGEGKEYGVTLTDASAGGAARRDKRGQEHPYDSPGITGGYCTLWRTECSKRVEMALLAREGVERELSGV